MNFAGGPAALCGMIMCVALAAWTLGRWQGGLVIGEAHGTFPSGVAGSLPLGAAGLQPLRTAAAPCQAAARAERKVALAAAASLGEIHAEISAYRRAEQVLAGLQDDPLSRMADWRTGQHECRYLGIMGEPTCGVLEVMGTARACGRGCNQAAQRAMQSACAVQPSPSVLAELTRV
jgi:hypothetical protein